MKVAELRELLKAYDAATLSEIAVTLYKTIPKRIKDENQLDELLKDFADGKQSLKKRDELVDIDDLKRNVLLFLNFAEAQYYLAPNQYVRKKDRPKWRFITKRYIKALLSVTGENSEEASELLILLYRMLSYACHYYLFNTEDPFRSAGYMQTDLFRTVIAKLFHNGITRASIQKAAALAIESELDRETLHRGLFFVLIEYLKTSDAKETAAEICVAYKENFTGASFFEDKRFPPSMDEYYKQDRLNLSVELYFYLKAELHEPETAIQYYWKNKKTKKPREAEIALYILLLWLEIYELPALWIAEYEKFTQRGLEPRKQLEYTYKKLKEGLTFSETYED
jgi:hypothetical protein